MPAHNRSICETLTQIFSPNIWNARHSPHPERHGQKTQWRLRWVKSAMSSAHRGAAFFLKFQAGRPIGKCRRLIDRRVVLVSASSSRRSDRWKVPTETFAIDERATAQDRDQRRGKLRALIVEDEPADVELALHALQQAGLEASADVVQTAAEFTDSARKNSYDVILADYKLPNWNGMESVEILRREGLDVPVILVSGALGELTAVDCIKQGAADYVLKDHLARLPESVQRAMREKKLREDHQQSQEDLARSNRDLEQFAYVASHDLQGGLARLARAVAHGGHLYPTPGGTLSWQTRCRCG
jgi:CheY-like chemotaxis protein